MQNRISSNSLKLIKKITGLTGKAILDYNMIVENDVVMVCVSGGKDSYTLLYALRELQKRAPIYFDIIAVHLDQMQPGFPVHILPAYFENLNIKYKIVKENTYSIVREKIPENKTYCSLCSRLRRGILYRTAKEIGATKIALGHHQDDIIETFFLNLFFSGRLKAIPPKLLSDDKENIVIRPLLYCREKDILKLSKILEFPVIPCNLCGSQKTKRQEVKQMLKAWEQEHPGRIESIVASLNNIVPSHLLDNIFFDFENIETVSGTKFKKEMELIS